MLIKTKEFKKVAADISAAVNSSEGIIELIVKDGGLILSTTNKEYYVAKYFPLENPESFHAILEANKFLKYISLIKTETFELSTNGTVVTIRQNKSKYAEFSTADADGKAELLEKIDVLDKEPIVMDIRTANLLSILTVNSAEVKKATIDANELQKLYYVTEDGCFTFTTGACLNSFELKGFPKILLKDEVVKLFKLFEGTESVKFIYGIDASANGTPEAKVIFKTNNTWVSAIVNTDDMLLNKIQGPVATTKRFINNEEDSNGKRQYDSSIMVVANELLDSIAALSLIAKDSKNIPVSFTFTEDEINMELTCDDKKIYESTKIYSTEEHKSQVNTEYTLLLNIADVKSVLDSCRGEIVTINFGNSKSVIITHSSGKIFNLIPESIKR